MSAPSKIGLSVVTPFTIDEFSFREAQRIAKFGYYDFDVINSRLSWSEQAAVNFGFPEHTQATEIKNLSEFIHPEDSSFVEKEWHNSIEKMSIFDCTYRVCQPSGQIVWIHSYGNPIFNHKKELIKIVGTLQDVTERKRLEEKVLRHQSALTGNAQLAALAQMASGVAHEINNPLAAISGYCYKLEKFFSENPALSKEMPGAVVRIEELVFRIAGIIKSLSFFARINDKNSYKEVLPAERVIKRTVQVFKEKFNFHGIDFQVHTDPKHVVFGSDASLSKAVLHLLLNAFDAVENSDCKKISIRTAEENDFIIFTITDSGPGLKDNSEKIFFPFYTTKEVGKGTGLGLSLVKGIAEDHQGSISFERRDHETLFRLAIPMKSASSKNL